MDEITADKWEEGFEEEINGALFNTETGPLWRVRLLRETLVDAWKVSKCIDIHISTCYLRRVLHLRASKKGAGIFTFLHGGEEFEVGCVPFRPAMESLMSNVIGPSVGERLLFSSYFTFQRVKAFFTKPQTVYLSVYPLVAKSDPSVLKKTCLLSRTLSEEETKLLVMSCKENKCTVHGAITASTHHAIARILQQKKHDLETPVSVESGYAVGLRKYCQPKVNKDVFGVYVCISALSVPVPLLYPDDKYGFWEFARGPHAAVFREAPDRAENVPLYRYSDVLQNARP